MRRIKKQEARFQESHSKEISSALLDMFRGETDHEYIAKDIAKGVKNAAFKMDSTENADQAESLIEKVIIELDKLNYS